MHGAMVAVGAGAMIGWGALPLLTRVAIRGMEDPRSRQRVLTLSLLLANALWLAPWMRIAWPTMPATVVPLGAVLLPAPALLDVHAICCLTEAIGGVWLALVSWTGARTLAQLARLRRYALTGQPAPDEMIERVRFIATEMRIEPPGVVVVNCSEIPFLTGVWKPVLALPCSLFNRLDSAALDLVIRHELAHLIRKDVLWNVIVAAACVPFGQHRTARRTSREIALAREEAVDSAVGSSNPCAYARMLVDVATGVSCRACTLVVGVEPTSLERRIGRLLEPRVEGRAAAWRVVALASILFAAAVVAPRLGLRP